MHKVLMWLIKPVLLFFLVIPERTNIALGKGFGLFLYHVIRYRRSLVLDNLQKAFREEKSLDELRAIARENYIHYGLCIVEFLRIPLLTKETLHSKITVKGTAEHVDNALKQGKGVILLCAHCGNWEMMAIAQAIEGADAHIITKQVKNNIFDSLWSDIRKSKGVTLLPNKKSGLKIFKLLKRNKTVALIFDQHRPGTMGVRVNFFGRPASTMKAVAVLALKTGCAVIPVNNWRDEDNIHHAEAGEPLPFIQEETEEKTILTNTQMYNDVLESYIRQHPEQWTWIHRRWK